MSRINKIFKNLKAENKKAFVAYICAGDPNFDTSLAVLDALVEKGVDIIELGVAFSDPVADGLVNQMAAERALKAGMNMPRLFELVRAFRAKHPDVGLVLFTYMNPIFSYGYTKFFSDATDAGIDATLFLDLPIEDRAELIPCMGECGMQMISLIAPTTPIERAIELAKNAQGFIYVLTRTGVTGAASTLSLDLEERLAIIRQHTDIPVCLGFGIGTVEQINDMQANCDGIIVGSALVKQIENNATDKDAAVSAVKSFIEPLVIAAHALKTI